LEDEELLNDTLKEFRPDAVIHFAASITSGRISTEGRSFYYRNNVVNSINLLEQCSKTMCNISSIPQRLLCMEFQKRYPSKNSAPKPNQSLWRIQSHHGADSSDITKSSDLRYIALRYFNVAGADAHGRLGQAYIASTHLITRALKIALGQYPNWKFMAPITLHRTGHASATIFMLTTLRKLMSWPWTASWKQTNQVL